MDAEYFEEAQVFYYKFYKNEVYFLGYVVFAQKVKIKDE